jgi:hypothetical protein
VAADPKRALDRIRTAQDNLLALHQLRYMAGSNRNDYLQRLERLEGYLRDAEDSIGTESESYQFQRTFANLDEARKALDDLEPVNPQEAQLVDSLYARLAALKSDVYQALAALGFPVPDIP